MPNVITGPVAVVMVLSFLLGIVTQLVKTGLLFNQYPVPQKWLPHLAVFGSFLAGFATSLGGAASPWTGWTFFVAGLAGGSALLATTPAGLATFAHHVVPDQVRTMRAARLKDKVDPARVLIGGVAP